jgi:hypothetical protein|uniref:Uncharacterized protein n=1 Tax=viral metagenome TaxID=1070528 RepID=A0A6C0IZG4_9ZZZZ
MTIYCGNNALDPKLLSGESYLGTNYKCLQKGIMKGKSLPRYTGDYHKIDTRKIYCGKSVILPGGYDYMGNLPICLSKGIGLGKARFGFNNIKKSTLSKSILFISNFSIIFILLILIKPKSLTYYDKKSKSYKRNILNTLILAVILNCFMFVILYFIFFRNK